MSEPAIYAVMAPRQLVALKAVRSHAEMLLNCSPRFRLFTLHGTPHITNLFAIADLLLKGGINLSGDEAYLLSLALCVHDLGMVVGLKDSDVTNLLQGRNSASDPAAVENQIRESHHLMVDMYLANNLNFMAGLGVTASELNQVSAISKCHRKVELNRQYGLIKYLGALMRVIDELDVGPERAPLAVLMNQFVEMDATSLWHWVKHNIAESWVWGHNVVEKSTSGRRSLEFTLIAHPANLKSVPYWLAQTRRPIDRVLRDDDCSQIIADRFNVHIEIRHSESRSSPSSLGSSWLEIEEKALSGGRKIVLLIDDENRKMDDLMLPVTFFAHVINAYTAVDAFNKIAAAPVSLAIVDMQISGHGLWTAEETDDYKTTGINIVKKIKAEFSGVKVGVLTATKHDIGALAALDLCFALRKPCDPSHFVESVKNALA